MAPPTPLRALRLTNFGQLPASSSSSVAPTPGWLWMAALSAARALASVASSPTRSSSSALVASAACARKSLSAWVSVKQRHLSLGHERKLPRQLLSHQSSSTW
eukprot:scaffold46526_cov30-Phaeocystis_antarctica.AAC.1